MSSATWRNVAHDVQDHRQATLNEIEPPIPVVPTDLPGNVTRIPQNLLLPHKVEITTTTVKDLIADLAIGALTSTEVTNAFLRRAGLAQRFVSTVQPSPYYFD